MKNVFQLNILYFQEIPLEWTIRPCFLTVPRRRTIFTVHKIYTTITL